MERMKPIDIEELKCKAVEGLQCDWREELVRNNINEFFEDCCMEDGKL